MAGITATYVDADTFTVVGDQTDLFIVGRRVKCNCGVDGVKYGTVLSSAYTTLTTVNLTSGSDNLTSNLADVYYGIIGGGAADQSMPEHAHDGNEGEGGLVGPIIQIVNKALSTVQTTTAIISPALTPVSTDGDAYDSQAITLNNASNKVRIQGVLAASTDNDSGVPTLLLHRSTTVLAIYATSDKKDFASQISFDFIDTPGSVGPHTYSLRVGTRNGDSVYINNDKANAGVPQDAYGGKLKTGSWLTLTEILV